VNKALIFQLGLAGGGIAVGFGAGYLAAKGRWQKRADIEIEQVKDSYKRLNKDGVYSDPKNLVGEYEETVQSLGYDGSGLPEQVQQQIRNGDISEEQVAKAIAAVQEMGAEVVPSSPAPETVVINVFNEAADIRSQTIVSEDVPYEISIQEFFEATDTNTQISIDYYDLDNTVVDERGNIIPDHESIVGAENLLKFGDRSEDNDIVYVRNPKLSTDFEITRNGKSYASEHYGNASDPVE
jgi:hypothetical protein